MKLVAEEYTQRQKIILTVYAILSLPLLPLVAVMYPISKWITQDANNKEEVKLSVIEFLSLSLALSLLLYIVIAMMYCCPPSH